MRTVIIEKSGNNYTVNPNGTSADIESNKDVTINVSTYSAPVEVTPSEGKDAMAKTTVTLNNIPGVTGLYGATSSQYFESYVFLSDSEITLLEHYEGSAVTIEDALADENDWYDTSPNFNQHINGIYCAIREKSFGVHGFIRITISDKIYAFEDGTLGNSFSQIPEYQ